MLSRREKQPKERPRDEKATAEGWAGVGVGGVPREQLCLYLLLSPRFPRPPSSWCQHLNLLHETGGHLSLPTFKQAKINNQEREKEGKICKAYEKYSLRAACREDLRPQEQRLLSKKEPWFPDPVIITSPTHSTYSEQAPKLGKAAPRDARRDPKMLAVILGSPTGLLPTRHQPSMCELAHQSLCCQDNWEWEQEPWGWAGVGTANSSLLHLAPAHS